MSSNINENKSFKTIELQLGDIIKISDPSNERIDEQTFMIDYLDSSMVKMTNTDSLESLTLQISEDLIIGNGTIHSISLLNRLPNKGYAKQNNLVPGTWINLHFGGEIPSILTGEITNLEEDMIEITTFPEGEVLYINFEYKGIPLDVPIDSIEIREKPEMHKESEVKEGQPLVEEGQPLVEEDQLLVEDTVVIPVKTQIRNMILKADQIQFGDEEFGPIVQYKNVDSSKQRFSIETQTSDLLDDLLSTIPNEKRTNTVLNNIHTMIERFKQLRQKFSSFDDYGNVSGLLKHLSNYKPLEEYFQKFNQNLYWILPVVKNLKKIYTESNDLLDNTDDNLYLSLNEDLSNITRLLEDYKSNQWNEDQSKYSVLYHDLNPYFTPFEYLSAEDQNQILLEKNVETNLHTLLDNTNDLYSNVFSKNRLLSKRFLLQKYNTGLQQLESTDLSKSQMNAFRTKLTSPDVLALHSFIMLPEPIIRYSRIQLPGTSILERSVLNGASLNYWELLKKSTSLPTLRVEDQEVEYDADTFAKHCVQFVLGNIESSSSSTSLKNKSEIYQRFINHLLPKTKVLFQLMKKYIVGKLSILEVVQYLEPFLVYTDDLTYMQYVEITQFINQKISEFNKRYLERERELIGNLKVKTKKPFEKDAFSLIQLIDQKMQIISKKLSEISTEELLNDYEITENKNEGITDSEMLRKILVKDQGRLFTNVMSLQNLSLMFPDDFTNLLEKEKEDYRKGVADEEPDKKCESIIIAKFYHSENELMTDNERDIYFDKKYDHTNYGIMDEYEKDMSTKSVEDFLSFLIQKLSDKYRLENKEAEYLADTLISGFKRVQDGQYAILYQPTTNTGNSFVYYVRKNNAWVQDDSVHQKFLQSVHSDDSGILCDLQKSCIQHVEKNALENKCESIEMNQMQLKEEILNQILHEFDEKYALSKEEFEKKMTKNFEYYSTILFPKMMKIEKENLLKYNQQKYKLGLQVENADHEKPAVLSPYAPIRDVILGQSDFVKKQNDLIRFVDLFCRKAIPHSISVSGSIENEHWLYCVKTNVELLPSFYYQLAGAFINTPNQYSFFLQTLVAKIGVLSEDGDAWTDKYTGREICKIDDSFDEGFDEGFKVSTRAVLEEDVSNRILVTNLQPKYDTVEMKIISNIVNTLSISMGITIENQKDFIINGVLECIKTEVDKKKSHEKKIKEMANKGIVLPSYEELYNSSLLYFTLGMFLIAVQTNIPSVRSRKTFPGCVRSFTGYPFEGTGDMSSLHYVSCIAYAIRKNSADPWTVLKKTKEINIANRIKNAIDTSLLKLPSVKSKMDEKSAYLILNPEIEILGEHDLSLWTQFLPPLVPFKIKHLVNISSEFESSLLSDLKTGNSNQHSKILVIQSKKILFSLAIQEKIQQVLSKKNMLLNKSNNEPYLENACCDEKSGKSFLAYFENKDSSIQDSNRIVQNLENILLDIRHYTEAQIFYSAKDTKNLFPALNQQFDEKTIYLGFIHFCRFNSLLPMDDDVLPLCTDKPNYLNPNESLNEMIQKLKNDGRVYTDSMFLRLLQMVNRKNIVSVSLDTKGASSLHRLTDTLESVEAENDAVVEGSLRNLISNAMDTFNIATDHITEETRGLNNFLVRHKENMKNELVDFMLKNKGAHSRREEKLVTQFISGLSHWKMEPQGQTQTKNKKISCDSLYSIIQFYKTFIRDLVFTFPNIILNQVDYSDIKIPAYWGISQKHASDIKKSIDDFYETLRQYYEDSALITILKTVQKSCKNLVLLSKETPCFTSIDYKNRHLKPVFDERTSNYLYEYYLLRILTEYTNLSEDESMITREKPHEMAVEDLFTVEYLEDEERKTFYNVVNRDEEKEMVLLRGNTKELKQKIAKLLVSYIKIMDHFKDIVDVSYQEIQDRIFKLKEKEKITITDRLELKTDEERDADTILKINKLGVWSKGLQKGLRTYVKENYDDEREFMETMMEYEKKVSDKKVSMEDFQDFQDDYLEEIDREAEIEKEANDMSHMTEDYMDGNEYQGNEDGDYENYY